jgi:hypothetical protein
LKNLIASLETKLVVLQVNFLLTEILRSWLSL